jgi:hypothetical protein
MPQTDRADEHTPVRILLHSNGGNVSGKSRLPRIFSFAFGSTYDAPIARKKLWS